MPKEPTNKKRHTMWLVDGDYEELKTIYPEVPAAVIIRTLVHKHVAEFKTGKAGKIKVEISL
jgi:hypothetical protein